MESNHPSQMRAFVSTVTIARKEREKRERERENQREMGDRKVTLTHLSLIYLGGAQIVQPSSLTHIDKDTHRQLLLRHFAF